METKALFITTPTNIRYLTGFVCLEPRDAYILQTNDTLYFFTNVMYREAARELKNCTIIEISRDNPVSKALFQLCSNQNIVEVEFEETDLTVAELRKLESVCTNVKFISSQNRIESKRMIKNSEEIENIRTAAKITDDCFSYIQKKLTAGVTESEIAWEIETFFKKNGAENAFSPIVAFGKNTSKPHYSPSNHELLTNNQIVLLDFGARVDGYCADMTRMMFFGNPEKEWIDAYKTLKSAQEKTIELLKNGEQDGKVLDDACRAFIRQEYPTYPHSLGHAVGLDIHEAPRLTSSKSENLKSGMIITIEPGIYIEGQFGMRIEDLILITDAGIEVLSTSSKVL